MRKWVVPGHFAG